MQQLQIYKIEQNETQTIISWARLDTDNVGWGVLGSWVEEGNLTADECVELAKTRVDAGIEVSLNLDWTPVVTGDGKIQ